MSKRGSYTRGSKDCWGCGRSIKRGRTYGRVQSYCSICRYLYSLEKTHEGKSLDELEKIKLEVLEDKAKNKALGWKTPTFKEIDELFDKLAKGDK